jgi:hypothetical protein
LFEHHPKRNIRSFFQTLVRSPLSQSNFWHTLAPAHRVRVSRLVLYWALYSLIALAPALLPIVWVNWNLYSSPMTSLLPWRSRTTAILSEIEYSGIVTAVVLLALFPWFNVLALLIFQQSMRRSRVKAVHVLRAAIYSGDLVVWFSIAASIVLATSESRDIFDTLGHPLKSLFVGGAPVLTLLGCGFLAMVILNSLRLWVAYRTYLRFQRAIGFVVASQIVVILATVAVLSWTSEYLR